MKFGIDAADPIARGLGQAIRTAALAPVARQQAERDAALRAAQTYSANMSGNKAGAQAAQEQYTLDQRKSIPDLIRDNPEMPAHLMQAMRVFGLTGDTNAERVASAGTEFQTQGIRDQALASVNDVDRMNRLNTLARPGSTYMPYDNVGNTGVSLNKATGDQIEVNPLLSKLYGGEVNSRIRENNAQAGAAGASAALSNERRRLVQMGDIEQGVDVDGNVIAYRHGTSGKVTVVPGITPRQKQGGADAAEAKMYARVAEQVMKDPMIAPEDQEAEIERRVRLSSRGNAQTANYPKAPQSASNMNAGAPSGIPSGSKQIGTAGGKPVWQAPNGKRYIVE